VEDLNIKERTMAAYNGENPDKIPWLIYNTLFPRGSMARKLRNKGLGLKVSASVLNEEMPNVTIKTKNVGNFVYKTFDTPIGSVSTKQRIGLSEGTGGLWTVTHPIQNISDFDIVEFIVEDTIYTPDYESFLNTERNLGSDGIVFVWAGRSPLQKMQIELLGYKNFAIAFFRFHRYFERLIRVLDKKAQERYKIIAESPAQVVNGTDNISSDIVNPHLFSRYLLPFYQKQHQLLNREGKILENHMDGKLKFLKQLISEMNIDVVEAFTPLPMGDLSLSDARTTWKGKVISLNFPGSVFLQGPAAIKKKTLDLLKEAAPGDNFIFTVTEDIPFKYRWESLLTITRVLERKGSYPLSFE
jgi:hypothetical protein